MPPTSEHSARVPGSDSNPADRWKRLLDFYASCVEQESALQGLLEKSASRREYYFPAISSEELISGLGTGLILDAEAATLTRSALQAGESLFYGFPTALIPVSERNVKGRSFNHHRLAPLFVVELALPGSADELPDSLEIRSEEPFLHPGVMARFGVKDEQLAQLAETLSMKAHLGTHRSVQRFLRDLSREISIPVVEDLDPASLRQPKEDEIEGVGLHNIAMVFRAQGSQYNQRLLQELWELRDKWHEARWTAASLLIPEAASSAVSQGRPPVPVTAPLPLNSSQQDALVAAMGQQLTVVTGPPGTGKSQLVTNVLATAWMAAQTVLVASNNNQAVDVVCERAQKIWKGLVIRTGSKENRERAREILNELLQAPGATLDSEAVTAGLEASRTRLESATELIERRTRIETRLGELYLTREHLAHRLGFDLGALPASIAGPRLRRRLRQGRSLPRAFFLKDWRTKRFLTALGLPSPHDLPEAVQFLASETEWRKLRDQEAKIAPIERLLRDHLEATESFRTASEAAVRCQAARAFAEGRRQLLQLVQARSLSRERNPMAEAFPAALPFARAWATTSLSAGASMPLRSGLFDLIILDEASQCSIPASIPLLFRAKRALIIGDPNQLSHVTTMTRAEEETRLRQGRLDSGWIERNGLSYRNHSIYRALEREAPKTYILDEHYRCHPQIIGISNQLFYGGRLAVLTDPSRLFTFGPHACAWRQVAGQAERPSGGSAQNPKEAQAVVEELLRIATTPGFEGSAGVVTPFAAQANLIERLAWTKLAPDLWKKLDLAIGTAHRFQGGERDVIVISPVASEGLPESSLRWLLGTPNLLNVAITRARAYLLVVGNRAYCETFQPGASQKNVLREMARYIRELEIESTVQETASRGDLHSEHEARLFEVLLRAGLPVVPKRLVHGYECDFALDLQGILVNIECDGWHHKDGLGRLRQQDRARDRVLEHSGWKVIRVPAWKCLSDPGCIAEEIAGLARQVPRR